MNTVAENLRLEADSIKAGLRCLLAEYAAIHHQPTQEWGGEIVQTPWGVQRRGGGIAIGYSAWKSLSPDGGRAQAVARERYLHFEAIARVLLRDQPQNVHSKFQEHHRTIMAALEQKGSPVGATPQDVLRRTEEGLAGQLSLLTNLYDASDGASIFVPDTNALLFNPHLEDWNFPDVDSFTLVLLPTVLGELDEQKINHRNETVRTKAEGLITRIKGYRARGKLAEGVPLRRNASRLMAWSVEPTVRDSLPWLDPVSNDDRILAGVIEVMRRFVHSPVTVVTRDINLQNKAEFAQVPFAEPPPIQPPAS